MVFSFIDDFQKNGASRLGTHRAPKQYMLAAATLVPLDMFRKEINLNGSAKIQKSSNTPTIE